MAKFELGKIVLTAGINELLADADNTVPLLVILIRHEFGDWGNLDDEDKAANDAAIRETGEPAQRVLSAYELAGKKVWIITEWDRSVTTVLFPSEY